MLTRLSLRLRIFLFFAFLALASCALAVAGLALGYSRLGEAHALSAFVIAGVTAVFAIVALTTWVWVLFDENVAKPVERLAAEMRARAHSDVADVIDDGEARFLGDLGSAAAAVASNLTETRNAMALAVGRETARLTTEKSRLEALLAEMPDGVIYCTPDHRIAFYNARCRDILGKSEALGLGRPLAGVLCRDPIEQACGELARGETGGGCDLLLGTSDGTRQIDAHLRLLRLEGQETEAPGYILTLRGRAEHVAPAGTRTTTPGVFYDFDLLNAEIPEQLAAVPLRNLTYVVFDTETTGLNPATDEVCQIAAVRLVNGRIVSGERFDMLVDPGQKIPAAATAVHHITNEMVAGAAPVLEALRRFHAFADGAVLVAHNAPFDMSFLRRREREIGLRFDQPILDTVLCSAILYGQSADHTLDALSTRLGVRIPDDARHTAIGDAIGTGEAFRKMIPMLEAANLPNLGALIQAFDRHSRLIQHLN